MSAGSQGLDRRSSLRAAARRCGIAGCLLSSLAIVADHAAAQLPVSLVTGTFIESYEFLEPEAIGLQRISLFTAPFGVESSITDRVSAGLRGTFAHGWMTRTDGSEATLSGLTDTEAHLDFEAVRDLLTLSVAGLIPTGQSTQTLDEAELAGLVAADLLPFRISNWGSGGALGGSAMLAVPLGSFAAGISVGYTLGREFTPMAEDELAYRPGDEIRVRVAVDRDVGGSGKFSLVAGGQAFQDDQLDGAGVFQPGNRVEVMGSYAFRFSESSAVLYSGVQHRASGLLLASSLETPAQDLVTTGVGLRIPHGVVTLAPSAELRIFRTADGVGQGHLATVGAAVEWPIGSLITLPTLRGRFGEALLWDGAVSPVRGLEMGVGIRYRNR